MASEERVPKAGFLRRSPRRSESDPRTRSGSDVTGRWLVRTTITVAIALGLFAAFALIVRPSIDDDAEVIGAARLTWDPETDDALGEGKAASVEIIVEDGRHSVFVYDIEVLRSPADFEFIEAWLVPADDSSGIDRVSIGEFDEIRTRLFPLAEKIDPLEFAAVELSLQDESNRGDYSGRSLLRGELVWLVDPPG